MKFHVRSILTTLILLSLISFSAQAVTAQFITTREDKLVPRECQNWSIKNFSENLRVVLYGLEGSREAGFSREYPISRAEAQLLFEAVKDDVQGMNSQNRAAIASHGNRKLLEAYDLLVKYGRPMGFDYRKEGDVLEVLALLDLSSEYNDNQYFRTGGISYSTDFDSVYGEIDILVARRSDCKVVAVGEAKLGSRQYGHAHHQMERLKEFLDRVRKSLNLSPILFQFVR